MEALFTVVVASMRRMADTMTPLQMTDLVMALLSKVFYIYICMSNLYLYVCGTQRYSTCVEICMKLKFETELSRRTDGSALSEFLGARLPFIR